MRMEKRLCFKCDEKWALGHRCRRSEVSVLLAQEEEGEEESAQEDDDVSSPDEPIHIEMSLNSVMGMSNPKTMKLQGKVHGETVVVMIDPGATHNFISSPVVTVKVILSLS